MRPGRIFNPLTRFLIVSIPLLKHFPFGSASLADISKQDIVKRLGLPPSEASHALTCH